MSGDLSDLQICFDDSLDLLALLVSVVITLFLFTFSFFIYKLEKVIYKNIYSQISGGKTRQWKLVLEHRSFGYNWLQQTRAQNDKEKRDGFMSYIRQLSKDKITLFIQGGSKGKFNT